MVDESLIIQYNFICKYKLQIGFKSWWADCNTTKSSFASEREPLLKSLIPIQRLSFSTRWSLPSEEHTLQRMPIKSSWESHTT